MAKPRDLFAEHGIAPPTQQGGRDLFAEHGIAPPPQTNRPSIKGGNLFQMRPDAEQALNQNLRQAGREAGPGAAQGYLNSLIGLANLLPKVNIPKAHFAPETPVAKEGEMAGDIASYFGPRSAIKLALGAKNLGKIGKYFESRPIQEFLAKNLGSAGEAGLFGASHAPEGQKGIEALKGMILGSATHAINNLLHIPYLGQAAGGTLGYLLGNQVGQPAIGSAIGTLSPFFVRSLFPSSKSQIMEEMIGGLHPRDVARVGSAAERQGIRVRPSEASGNPIQAQVEAFPRKTVMGAQEHIRQELGREHEQQNAIRNFLDKIYHPTPKNEQAITDAYKKANQVTFHSSAVDTMKQDPILREAFASVGRNPAFENVPEGNYKYMAEVSRTLERMKRGEKLRPNTAYEIGQVQGKFNQFLKKMNPEYEAATKVAQPKMQRRDIEERLNEDIENERFTGRDFYNKVLKNYKSYKELVKGLRNNPEARQSLQDMRIIFKNMTKLPTVGATAERTAQGWNSPRDWFNTLVGKMKDLAGAQTDVKKIKYINSGEWMKDFDKLAEIKDARKYQKEVINLVGRVALAYGLSPAASENFKKAISE